MTRYYFLPLFRYSSLLTKRRPVRRPAHRSAQTSTGPFVSWAGFFLSAGLILTACINPPSEDAASEELSEHANLVPVTASADGTTTLRTEATHPISTFAPPTPRATSTDADDPATSLHEVGLQNHHNGELVTAIDFYSRAIEQNAEHPDAFFNRALAQRTLHNHAGSVVDLTAHLALNPHDARAFNSRGLCNQALADHTNALSDFNQALQLDPRFTSAYANRSNTLYQLGEFEMAIEDLDLAIGLDPTNSGLHFNRGLLYNTLGQSDKAMTSYDDALILDSKTALMFHERGFTHFELGNMFQAQSDFESAIDLSPKDPKGHYNLGLLHHSQERSLASIGHYTVALQLDPSYRDALKGRAIAYAATGQRQRAVGDLEQLMKIVEPSDPDRSTIAAWVAAMEAGDDPFL